MQVKTVRADPFVEVKVTVTSVPTGRPLTMTVCACPAARVPLAGVTVTTLLGSSVVACHVSAWPPVLLTVIGGYCGVTAHTISAAAGVTFNTPGGPKVAVGPGGGGGTSPGLGISSTVKTTP